MSDLLLFSEITHDKLELVGGKGLSLGLMAGSGLPVPPGFCITSVAYRRAGGQRVEGSLADTLMRSYRDLGGGLVAVRSSATAEDGATASFAGQQETILGVEGEAAVREAVERCWRSLHTERAIAYRRKQGIDETGIAMSVVVQRLIHAEVAGVMFTRDPLDATGERMSVEASWGLGEAVVSGRVSPDRFQVDRSTGKVQHRELGRKHIRIGVQGEEPVAVEQQNQFCLSDTQLGLLAELGRRVEKFYGDARDIEWAFAEGRCWLLQARPITTSSAAERAQVCREEIARLKTLADPKGTVWSRFNLIEVLPEPTPMTWAVVQRLLSGNGGTGMMYRDLGFTPHPDLATRSVYDLIGGRPYCNLSLEPKLQSPKPVFGYPFAKYRQDPNLALDPKPDTGRMLGGFWRWLRLPGVIWSLIRSTRRIQLGSVSFAESFRAKTIPAYLADLTQLASVDVSKLSPPQLVERLEILIQRTLVEFARESLKPTLFAQFSMQVLEQQLKKPLGPERTREALAELSTGAHADADADLPQAVREFTRGEMNRATFLERFGHRGSHEMELMFPRWSEDPSTLPTVSAASGITLASTATAETSEQRVQRIITEAKLNSFVAKSTTTHVERLRTYLGLRETGKHYLMRGYALIRSTLLELDRRFNLQGGIFYLTLEELPQLIQGHDFAKAIAERRQHRTLLLTLEVPPVVFSDDLEGIGRPLPAPVGSMQLQGTPLSAGVAEGKALVLSEPTSILPDSGYILVCPSTDPAWVPLFVHAKGLVMESGGALSHGAIVAREFGIPAVAGLPDIHRQLRTGQRLRIDGGRGLVAILAE